MKALIDMFKGFFDAIGSIIDFIVDFFQDLVYVISLLGKFVVEIPTYFSFLPPSLLVMIGTIFSVVVIYMVVGRK